MGESISEEAVLNNFEHLKEPSDRIVACIGEPNSFGEDFLELKRATVTDNPAVNVDFIEEHVFSKVDSSNKYSEGYIMCTGVVAVGRDKNTGENISFVSHQYPGSFLFTGKEKFEEELVDRLQELLLKSEEGTIDVVIVGGSYDPNFEDTNGLKNDSFTNKYVPSIKFLSRVVKDVFGFDPSVIVGPKIIRQEPPRHFGNTDDIYFDNKNRRLYIVRDFLGTGSGSFDPKYIEEERDKWDRENKI